MKKEYNISDTISKIENFTIVRSIRNGLIHIIPVLIIGAFALILQTFPVEAYTNAINTFLGGFFLNLFNVINKATFGVLSVYMTYSISREYTRLKSDSHTSISGAVVSSILVFFILAGAYLPNFGTDQMGPKSMFLAIITGLGASATYLYFYKLLQKARKNTNNAVGSDREFNKMIVTVLPIAIVSVIFGIIKTLIVEIFNVDSFRSLIINAFNWSFSFGEVGFFKGFFFVLISSILWFFGVHGSDTLEGVMQTYFVPGLEANQAAVAAGGQASAILTKEFFDCFVLMGGCGATICLLIAILAFSKNKARKSLGLTAAFPMIFNINELMVFGLPIIFNPIMLIPFLIVPLVCYSVAYIAISTGLVPMITNAVEWTTPIILGGYTATGSIAGSVLQIINVLLGVLIYLPFVRLLDKQSEENTKKNFDLFMNYFKENENQFNGNKKIIELGNFYGDYAKDLCNDLRYSFKKGIVLAYQPQYKYDGECFGAEALLRFEHPVIGMLYPPLVIKLAEEGGFLAELEERILKTALDDYEQVEEKFGKGIKVSVNVTGTTVITPRYVQYCGQLKSQDLFKNKKICIEITEQAAISISDETLAALKSIKEIGLSLAIDDFSMGQTSIKYLREDLFDIIKLDGSLVDGLFTHDNTQDIVSSIIQLSKSLNLVVLAEYVDLDKKREILHKIGCDYYQGYLYSPAVFLEKQKKDNQTKEKE